jgi:hypothetical protein
MPDAVALSAEGPEREDLQLVWLIADGLATAAGKLRSYCHASIVVLGEPAELGDPEAENHSCDGMGCGQEHVLARGPVTGDAWPDSCVQTLLSLLEELLCRVGTGEPYDYHHEATALVQSVLCQTADWSHVEARLAELRSKKAS